MTRRQETRRNVAYVLLGLVMGTAMIVVGLFGYTPWNDATAAPQEQRESSIEYRVSSMESPEEIR